MYTGSRKRQRVQSWNFADWLHITIYGLFTPCSICFSEHHGKFTINQQEFAPTSNLCIGDMTLWIHLKASKTDHSDMESTFWNYVLSLYRLCKMFKLKNVPTYPLFLNESGSALSRTKYLFHIKQILHLDLLTGFGLVFPRALISYCSQ